MKKTLAGEFFFWVLSNMPLIQVFPRRQLAEILMKMISSLPSGQLTEQVGGALQMFSSIFLFGDFS